MSQNPAKTKRVIRETVEHLLELSHGLDEPLLLHLLSMAKIVADEDAMRDLQNLDKDSNRKETTFDLAELLRLFPGKFQSNQR